MSHALSTILFFARWPEPGRVKTRLAADVGRDKACRIHAMLAEHCFAWAMQAPDARVIVCGTGASPIEFAGWLQGAGGYWQQPEGGLGERLEAMFSRALEQGAHRVVAMGSDCPELSSADIAGALHALSSHDVSVLPARDGGYVLIGLRRLHRDILRDMPWSTERLLAQTIARCTTLGLTVHVGDMHQDVDTVEDWNLVSGRILDLSSRNLG